MSVPFIDLKAAHADLKEEMLAALEKVIDSAQFILAENVAKFEEEFGRFCGSNHAAAVGSGTDALVLALDALGIGRGDEVIVPAWSFVATAAAVWHVGAKPVFVDCGADSFLMDFEQAADKINPKTRAIIPVHLYGEMADVEKLANITKGKGIKIIEDVAQAGGAALRGKTAGSIGDAGCFSFYPTKTLGACGEGGMIITNDGEINKKVRHLRNQADDTMIGGEKYHHSAVGYNSRLQEFQAAILRIKLRRLSKWNRQRQAIAKAYCSLLKDCPVKLPHLPEDGSHVYSLFTIRTAKRDALSAWLKARGIGSAVIYPRPLHLQPAYGDLDYKAGDLPIVEAHASEVLSLPMYPQMTEAQAEEVAQAVKEFFAK